MKKNVFEKSQPFWDVTVFRLNLTIFELRRSKDLTVV